MAAIPKTKNKKFLDPPPSATPQQRRRLTILTIMAGIIIILLWIFFLPYSFRQDQDKTVSSNILFSKIGDAFSQTIDSYQSFTNKNQP